MSKKQSVEVSLAALSLFPALACPRSRHPPRPNISRSQEEPVALLATPASLFLLLLTRLCTQLTLILAISATAAFAESTSDDTVMGQQTTGPPIELTYFSKSLVEQAWSDWKIRLPGANDMERHAYLQVGFGLLLLLLPLAYKFHGRPGTTQMEGARNVALTLLIMPLFMLMSLLLLTSLQPRDASMQHGQQTDAWKSAPPGSARTHAPVFTIPPSADVGINVLPNIKDPEAVNPQTVCPGYRASNIHETESGFTADLDLAGGACNVYGNDIENLTLFIEFQADDRVHVEIRPRHITSQNETWFLLPEQLVPRPSRNLEHQKSNSNMIVSWSNDPVFSFSVKRRETGDTLFSTEGSVLVYEDQFIEFGSPLPENYNIYGLGEVIHGFRLGNNLTSMRYGWEIRRIKLLIGCRDSFRCRCGQRHRRQYLRKPRNLP